MKKYFIIGFLVGGFLTSCIDDEKPCTEERDTAAIVTQFPDSLKVGDHYDVEISYILENSCGNFDRFEVSQMGSEIIVRMITKYEGCNCDLTFTEANTTYDITADFPGIYEYKFWQASGDYDSRTLVIYE